MNAHAPLPVVSTLMMDEAHDLLKRIGTYAEITNQYASIDDVEGFVAGSEALLAQARLLSKLLKTLKDIAK